MSARLNIEVEAMRSALIGVNISYGIYCGPSELSQLEPDA